MKNSIATLRQTTDERTMDEGRETKRLRSVRDLEVYKLAFDAAMEIHQISKSFPKEETYSLTDQIRRSSRSVCSCLAEGWRKRRYKAVFVNKISDSAQEAAEVQTWLEFALKCGYIDVKTFELLDEKYEHIFAMLNTMERKADTFCNATMDNRRGTSDDGRGASFAKSSIVLANEVSGRPSSIGTCSYLL